MKKERFDTKSVQKKISLPDFTTARIRCRSPYRMPHTDNIYKTKQGLLKALKANNYPFNEGFEGACWYNASTYCELSLF